MTFWTTVSDDIFTGNRMLERMTYQMLSVYFIDVTLHEESSIGDIGSPGSLHRLLRGLADQRAQKRDEFITVELTNHLFQSGCK